MAYSQSKNKYSSFWLGDKFEDRYIDTLTGATILPQGSDIFKLVEHQRAIANFVRIACGKDIPTRFSTTGQSYTTGKEVVLSSDIESGNFDIAVGLALHEGSHILLTNFDLLPHLKSYYIGKDCKLSRDTKQLRLLNKIFARTDIIHIIPHVKVLLNIIEDRRIDRCMKDRCPGYVGYYTAMYDHYFNSKTIDKMLKKRVVNGLDIPSYIFHITNFTNPKRTLDILPGLQEMYNVFDIDNISRLKSTMDAFDLALIIMDMILKQTDKNPDQSANQQSQPNDQNDNDDEGDDSDDEENEEQSNSGKEGSRTSYTKLIKKYIRAIQKQNKFTESKLTKKNIGTKTAGQIKSAIESNVCMRTVDIEKHRSIDTIVIKTFSQVTIDAALTEMTSKNPSSYMKQNVSKGYQLGAALASKLLVRNEEFMTKFSRQDTGRIDKRLLAELGCDNARVFEQTTKDYSKEVSIYISIDASGSMDGPKFNNSIMMAVAIARAAELVRNIRVIIDVRAAEDLKAIVLVAYDSKYDKTSKILKLFPHLSPTGGTPEGVAFNAISKLIEEKTAYRDSYFINLSDGAPAMNNFSGKPAAEFTREEVEKIRRKGVEVLSYLIGYDSLDQCKWFVDMYGKDARCIDANNITSIAKTINELLSRRNNSVTV